MYQYSKFMITFVAVSLLVIYLVLKQMPRLRSFEKFRSSTMQIIPTEKSGLKCYVEGLKLSKLVLFYSGTIHLFPPIRLERKVVSRYGWGLSVIPITCNRFKFRRNIHGTAMYLHSTNNPQYYPYPYPNPSILISSYF